MKVVMINGMKIMVSEAFCDYVNLHHNDYIILGIPDGFSVELLMASMHVW